MKEIERRFRFKRPEDVTILLDFEKKLNESEKFIILQGYYANTNKNTCRVRIQKDINGVYTSFLTLKTTTLDVGIRDEFEFKIDNDMAFEIMEKCNSVLLKKRCVSKNMAIDFLDCSSRIDKIFIEIENNDYIPSFCGEDVTRLNTSYEYSLNAQHPKIIRALICNFKDIIIFDLEV
jgi:CYTH domain-containing protein